MRMSDLLASNIDISDNGKDEEAFDCDASLSSEQSNVLQKQGLI